MTYNNITPLKHLWLSQEKTEPDTRCGFRGRFVVADDCVIQLSVTGSSWFDLFLDGRWIFSGPERMSVAHPRHRTLSVPLKAGKHVLAAHVVWHGVSVRTSDAFPPFIAAKIQINGEEITADWRCLRLDGHWRAVRRINELQGWIDWEDMRRLPVDWEQPGFDDAGWEAPVEVEGFGRPSRPVDFSPVKRSKITLKHSAAGPLAEVFGYETEDPPTRFFLRDLECSRLTPQGIWRRYDLGQVRVGVPEFVLDLPEGAVIEICSAERLEHGRASPWIPWSLGLSCCVDHYHARKGRNVLRPLNLRGARYVEIHVLAQQNEVRWEEESWLVHGSLGEPVGTFDSPDTLLNRIWETGINTMWASCTDTVIDSVREHGQWGGDAFIAAGLLRYGWGYSRHFLAAMRQLAEYTESTGLVAGHAPGHPHRMPTFAAQWARAVLFHFEATGDEEILRELWPSAQASADTIAQGIRDDGPALEGWNFVDWSYPRRKNGFDPAVSLVLLEGLRATRTWAVAIGESLPEVVSQAIARLERLLNSWLSTTLQNDGWRGVGWHTLTLMLHDGFITKPADINAALDTLEAFASEAHPWKAGGPGLSDMRAPVPNVPTPFFMAYVLEVAARHGRIRWSLDAIRTAWGWCLDQGLTTWPEVFDTRWSHCHNWSGYPTTFLTENVLGVRLTRGKIALNHVECGLPWAKGTVPLEGGGVVHISWIKEGNRRHWSLNSDRPVEGICQGQPFTVRNHMDLTTEPSGNDLVQATQCQLTIQ